MLRVVEYGLLAVSLLIVLGLIIVTPRTPIAAEPEDPELRQIENR
jgi:hypothetical protein